ncbi:MAG: TatD family hydrolase [Candidatus Peribacteraceae bacterium]|nr:TatD family hydrolase [Candidatus Peribacteraceae bacterium]
MIDSHCHLADRKFNRDIDEVLKRAKDAGVDRVITIADEIEESRKCLEIAQKYEQVFCTIGIHPHCSKDWNVESETILKEMIKSSKKVVAIGEIGLDYYYDNSPRDVQREVFRAQLKIAKDFGLPSVVHNRESIKDLKEIINEINPPFLVIHCCTEKWEDVVDLVDRGYFLSFTGIATYPKSNEIRRTIKMCPLDQLMIETDAPYLAPDSMRGKRNEPAFVIEIAKCIAQVKGMGFDEIDEKTTRNTEEFFRL